MKDTTIRALLDLYNYRRENKEKSFGESIS